MISEEMLNLRERERVQRERVEREREREVIIGLYLVAVAGVDNACAMRLFG